MTKILFAAVLTLLTGALILDALPADTVANSEAVPPSFDVAMPAPQEPASAPEMVAGKY
jgi:hypothetical protein